MASRHVGLILLPMRPHRLLIAVPWLLLGGLAAAATAENVAIAAQGRPLQPVVISARAGAPTKAVAQKLAVYLSRMTGAKFEVTTGEGRRGIVLGTLADFPKPPLYEPLAIRNDFDGKEAFAIRTERERLLLIGATELGASHAHGQLWFFNAPNVLTAHPAGLLLPSELVTRDELRVSTAP